jgi:hypothetical protein
MKIRFHYSSVSNVVGSNVISRKWEIALGFYTYFRCLSLWMSLRSVSTKRLTGFPVGVDCSFSASRHENVTALGFLISQLRRALKIPVLWLSRNSYFSSVQTLLLSINMYIKVYKTIIFSVKHVSIKHDLSLCGKNRDWGYLTKRYYHYFDKTEMTWRENGENYIIRTFRNLCCTSGILTVIKSRRIKRDIYHSWKKQ